MAPSGDSDGAVGERDERRRMIETAAAEAGFDAWGIVRTADLPSIVSERLDRFLALGLHGDMGWMAAKAELRRHPQRLWPEARSAVMLAMSYAPRIDPMQQLERPTCGAISVYAQSKDYHDVVKPRLKRVAGTLQRAIGGDVKVFVDTAPLMEKPLAALAGIGWQGKHTNLVSRQHGSWLFLGAILTTVDLLPDMAEADHCGSCTRCLDICPTRAFVAPRQLDARRCISYLTIEHRGVVPRTLRAAIGNRIYGCDDCLAVCPWNKFAASAREILLQPRPGMECPELRDLLVLDDAHFRQRFAGSPIKRSGRDRFVRNVLVAAGNSGDPSLLPAVEPLLDDPAEVVRGTAIWAVARLAGRTRLVELAIGRREHESSAVVLEEWSAELEG